VSDRPDESRGYENWIGYKRLKSRLETLMQFINRPGPSQGGAGVYLTFKKARHVAYRFFGKDIQLVFPRNKKEFEESAHSMRLSFTVATPESNTLLEQWFPNAMSRYAVHEISIWANTGGSGNVSCIYKALELNENSGEVHIVPLGEGRYEIGLNAAGNIFDTLLISDEFWPQPKQGGQEEERQEL
jgi:hypothetical protein